MRGAALPAALVLGVLAMLLAFAPVRLRLAALALAAATACAVARITVPPQHVETAFGICWLTLLAIAGAVFIRPPLSASAYIGLAALGGIGAGAAFAAEADGREILKAIAALALMFPARALATRGCSIALRVLTSWAVAIGVLSAAIPLATATPGYKADHRD